MDIDLHKYLYLHNICQYIIKCTLFCTLPIYQLHKNTMLTYEKIISIQETIGCVYHILCKFSYTRE